MRRFMIWGVVLALVVVVGHDVSKYAEAQRHIRGTTYEVTQWAGQGKGLMTRDQAAMGVAEKAAAKGVTVYQYGQTETQVQVWASYPVTGTWVLGTAANMISGMSYSEAKTAPYIIKNYRESRLM